MIAEIWNPIPGFCRYEASNEGRIRRVKGPRCKQTRLRKSHVNPRSGYAEIMLSVDGEVVIRKVHRLVYSAFGSLDESKTINHIDGNKLNNHISNLEAVSQRDNNLHSYRCLNRPRPRPCDIVRNPENGRILSVRSGYGKTGEVGSR